MSWRLVFSMAVLLLMRSVYMCMFRSVTACSSPHAVHGSYSVRVVARVVNIAGVPKPEVLPPGSTLRAALFQGALECSG